MKNSNGPDLPIIGDKQGIRGLSNLVSQPIVHWDFLKKLQLSVYFQVSEVIKCTSPITSLKFSSDLQFLNLSGELWQPHVARSYYNKKQITSALGCQNQTDGEQGNSGWWGKGGNSTMRLGLQHQLPFQGLPDARETHQSSAFHVII